ncbi:uncharacterized protein [Dermacentor albipictus]|uniref:uncharacterized protein n=1 Tax=Dermacentor albipictus TaxID=60249 RepID=UPI0038FCD17D
MARVFELAALCSSLRAEAATERGAVLALQGQLVETRREVAVVQRRAGVAECRLEGLIGAATGPAGAGLPGAGGAAAVGAAASSAGRLLSAGAGGACASSAAPMAPGAASYAAALRSRGLLDAGAAPGAPGGAGAAPAQPLHDHVCFLTRTAETTTPAGDVVRLLKTNIDPATKGIREVSLRHTRERIRRRPGARATPARPRLFPYTDGPDDHASEGCRPSTQGNHLGDTCTVRMRDEAVRCAECDRAGLSSARPAGFPQCPILMERVARLRARTNYGDP